MMFTGRGARPASSCSLAPVAPALNNPPPGEQKRNQPMADNQQFRTEKDSMGEMKVPADAYYGASTARAVENFPISDLRFPRRFIAAMGIVKWACVEASAGPGVITDQRKALIQEAAQEVMDGQLDRQFVVDIVQ